MAALPSELHVYTEAVTDRLFGIAQYVVSLTVHTLPLLASRRLCLYQQRNCCATPRQRPRTHTSSYSTDDSIE